MGKNGWEDGEVSLEAIDKRIDSGHSLIYQYIKTGGKASFNRDFSYGKYKFKFTD